MDDGCDSISGEQPMVEEAEEISEDVGAEDAARPTQFRSPGNPTKAEIEDHDVTHLPYRSWCSHCVRGKVCRRSAQDTAEGRRSSSDPANQY